jgi:hypothetical protein
MDLAGPLGHETRVEKQEGQKIRRGGGWGDWDLGALKCEWNASKGAVGPFEAPLWPARPRRFIRPIPQPF